MGNLTTITETIGNVSAGLNEFVSDNKTTIGYIASGVAGAALGAGIGYLVGKKSAQKKRASKSGSKRKRSSRSGSGRARDRRYISKQKHERYYAKTHPKRRKTGKYYKSRKKGRHYTKNGQPYIILKSGKARFVKK